MGTAPLLRRVNGFGFALAGTLTDEWLKPLCFKMYWFTALWVPLIPICVYLVDTPIGSQYRFYKKMGLADFHSVYRRRLVPFYVTVLGETVLWLVIVAIALAAIVGLRYLFRR